MQNQVVQPEGNYYDKYHSSNPIVKKIMRGFFKSIEIVLRKYEVAPKKILEAGCGEGEVTRFLRTLYPDAFIDAFDISDKVIAEIPQEENSKIKFCVGDIYTMTTYSPYSDEVQAILGGYDLVVCSEVMEHLEMPEKALEKLKAKASGYILLSVPNEPIWRILNMCRGKYLKQLGNTPGHIQHWSMKQFCNMLRQNGCEIAEVRRPFPWTVVLVKNVEKTFTKQ